MAIPVGQIAIGFRRCHVCTRHWQYSLAEKGADNVLHAEWEGGREEGSREGGRKGGREGDARKGGREGEREREKKRVLGRKGCIV
jgi:hypothetical protein